MTKGRVRGAVARGHPVQHPYILLGLPPHAWKARCCCFGRMVSSPSYFRFRLALLLLYACCVRPVQSLVPETTKQRAATRSDEELSRRNIIRGLSSAALIGSILLNPQSNRPALALKPNNEALCGTGFFTNIAQYKCTDIGDISDEGKSRKVSAEEDSRMDSLMSKFGDLDLSGSSTAGGSEGSGDTTTTGSSQDGKDNE